MGASSLGSIYRYHAWDDRLSASGQPTEAQLAWVAREGFDVVINLGLHDDPRYSLRDEASTVMSLGMDYVHIPVPFDAPSESGLQAFFGAMERRRDQKIFVHCAANIRVSAFLGLWRAIEQGQPVEAAFAPMKAIWEPNSVWSAFISAMLASRSRKHPALGGSGTGSLAPCARSCSQAGPEVASDEGGSRTAIARRLCAG